MPGAREDGEGCAEAQATSECGRWLHWVPAALKKPAEAVGKQIYVLGQYWENCPAEDKSKEYNCVVTDFDAIHTWPDGNAKTSAMKVMMLGVKDGPQIDSGDHFWMRYPLPFLEYFYKAHPLAGEELTATAE